METQNNPFIQAMSNDTMTSKPKIVNDLQINLKSERLLSKLSKVALVIGLLLGFIVVISSLLEFFEWGDLEDIEFGILAYGLAIMLGSATVYAFLQVFIQISLTLKNGKTFYGKEK